MDLKILAETPSWEWPDDADQTLLKILTDDGADASRRLVAAELAGDFTVINDDLAEALLAVLQNESESEELRATAAIALGPALDQADTMGFDDPDDVPISEEMYRKTQQTLHQLYLKAAMPKNVRRRILEASVRAPRKWHPDAIREAYSSEDADWKMTAVFSMRWVPGFDEQIVESLASDHPEVHYQAICAAGNWEVDAAWRHVAGLVKDQRTDKRLLLAAIDAVAGIRPREAETVLYVLLNSEDEDIAEAAHEAIAMAEGLSDSDLYDADDDL